MPDGGLPPGASPEPTHTPSGYVVPGSAAPTVPQVNDLASLQAWSGSGSVDNRLHQSFLPAQLNGVAQITANFAATRLVVQNLTSLELFVALGSTNVDYTPGSFDFIVPAWSVLDVRVPPTLQVALLGAFQTQLPSDVMVDVYLLSGAFAAQGPAYRVTGFGENPLGGEKYAFGSAGITTVTAPLEIFPTDPFGSSNVHLLDQVQISSVSTGTTTAAGTGTLFIPTPTGGIGIQIPFGWSGAAGASLNVPATTQTFDMFGVPVGDAASGQTPTVTSAESAAGDADISAVFLYR
ncbi:MAG: hypothetical protein ACYCVN_12330 [Acidimicrobiales bacterium]